MSRSIQTKEASLPVINESSLRHHRSDPTQMSTASEVESLEEAANKSYTPNGSLGSTASAEVCSCQSEWQTKEEQI
jgi:hypothetical protein